MSIVEALLSSNVTGWKPVVVGEKSALSKTLGEAFRQDNVVFCILFIQYQGLGFATACGLKCCFGCLSWSTQMHGASPGCLRARRKHDAFRRKKRIILGHIEEYW